jgi:hypothetical protein
MVDKVQIIDRSHTAPSSKTFRDESNAIGWQRSTMHIVLPHMYHLQVNNGGMWSKQ